MSTLGDKSDTHLHSWHVTSDCREPVNIWSMMQLQLCGLPLFVVPFVPDRRNQSYDFVYRPRGDYCETLTIL